jgi:hypothetical protein
MCAGRTWWKAPLALVLTAQLLPAPAPAVAALADGPGRLIVRASFRSASPEAASALAADLPATVAELFAGEMIFLSITCTRPHQNVSFLTPNMNCLENAAPILSA